MQTKETILFVSEARLLFKGTTLNNPTNSINTGLSSMKLVVTVNRLYLFDNPANETQATEYRMKKMHLSYMQQKKGFIPKEYYSVTGEPESAIEIDGRQCKVVTEESEEIRDFIVKKLGVLNSKVMVKNMVLLLNTSSRRMNLIFFEREKPAIRFARSIKAANAWLRYAHRCKQQMIPTNPAWAIMLQDYVYDEETIFVVDPLNFHDGISDDKIEMKMFCFLVDLLRNISGLRLKFNIKEEYGYQCLNIFITGIQSINHIRILILDECQLSDDGVAQLTERRQDLTSLTKLSLAKNKLTDVAFTSLREMVFSCHYLKDINLSHNAITLMVMTSLISMLKVTKQFLLLNLSCNNIGDTSIENIEEAIIYALDPPIEEIDLSYNKFSRYGEWKVFVGSMVQEPYHPYLKLILYPVPFHLEIFKNIPNRKWSVRQPDEKAILSVLQSPKNSSMIQDFSVKENAVSRVQSQSNTNVNQVTIGIKIKRNVLSNKASVKTEDLEKINKVKQELGLMINSNNVTLQRLHKVAKQISSYDFIFPVVALEHISEYLWERMNEALLVRDHEAIELIVSSCRMLGVNISSYKDRLQRVEQRKTLFCLRISNLLNLQMNEMELVPQLEELIKESLRLCLKGTVIDILFYIKFLKDQKVKSLINSQYSPYVELQDRKIESYAKLYENASEHREEIPQTLRKRKEIDVNICNYYLYVNYFLLAMVSRNDYEQMVEVVKTMAKSNPEHNKFLFLALQRINFILNEFYKSFIYSVFSISYLELKINSCRLVWHYNNIKNSVMYSDLPNFPRKVPITPERNIKIANKPDFIKAYSIENHDNIRADARELGLTNHKGVFTRYLGKIFSEEVKKLCKDIFRFFEILCTMGSDIKETIVVLLLDIIKFLRGSVHVNELLEEFYLHIISFEGNQKAVDNLLKMIPFLTMYLRPPEVIQPYLIAFLAAHDFNFDFTPLSVVFEKKPLGKFVDRDWLPKPQQVMQLIRTCGMVVVPLTTAQNRPSIQILIPESKTIGQLMEIVYLHEILAEYEDRAAFWVYKLDIRTNVESILLFDDYIGEVMSTFNDLNEKFVVRRRIYSPYYVINYHKYSDSTLHSVYNEVREFYLRGLGYTALDENEIELAAIIAVINAIEEAVIDSRELTLTSERDIKFITEGLRDKKYKLLPSSTVEAGSFRWQNTLILIKDKVVNEILPLSNMNVSMLQRRFLSFFRDNHYYCSSNYSAYLYEENQKCWVSVNSQFICVETLTDQRIIFYESLLSLCPEEKFLNIYYYDKEKLETVEIILQTETRMTIAIVMDILSYCILRLYTSSIYIYLQRELHEILIKHDYPISAFDPEKQERGEQAIMRNLKPRRGQSSQELKETVANINNILMKIRTIELPCFKKTDFIFQQEIKYAKWELDRDVFPLKSNRNLMVAQLISTKEPGLNLEISESNALVSDPQTPVSQYIGEEKKRVYRNSQQIDPLELDRKESPNLVEVAEKPRPPVRIDSEPLSPDNFTIHPVFPEAPLPTFNNRQIPVEPEPIQNTQQPQPPAIISSVPLPPHPALMAPTVDSAVQPPASVQPQLSPVVQQLASLIPPPVSPEQPMPGDEQEVVTVIKPRNSNKMFDRASRRRNG